MIRSKQRLLAAMYVSVSLYSFLPPARALAATEMPSGPHAPQGKAAEGYVARFSFQPGYSWRPVRVVTTISRDGVVVYETYAFRDKSGSKKLVAQITREGLLDLEAAIERIMPEDLKDQDSGKAECADAPSTEYSVVKGNGREAVISKSISCHRHEMPDSDEARMIRTLLEGLTELGSVNSGEKRPKRELN